MKLRRPPLRLALLTAAAILAAASLLSVAWAPQHVAFADPGGNGKGGGKGGDNGNGGHSGEHGGGNGKGGGNGNGNGGGNGNGSGNGNGKEKGDDDGTPADAPGGAPAPGGAMPDERTDSGHDRVVRNEIVVAEAGVGLDAFAQSRGFRVLRTENLAALDLQVTRLQAPDGLSTSQARELIAQAFPDAIVDLNHLYQPQTSLSLPAADYAAKAVRWSPRLRDCGGAARLGLIDTAVDWSMPILKGARGQTGDFLETGIEPAPRQHGTGIATLLVGQQGFGLLPGAELYSAAIFGLDGDGRPIASATSFTSALNWLLSNKVATINVSLSGPPDRLMELAVKRAQQRGAELVAAVGNDGTTDVPRFPAAYPGVIGVTAVDQSGHVFSGANRGDFVALAAPGVDLLIPGQPGQGQPAGQPGSGANDRLVTGTSFAVPYVTAALASYGNDPARMFAGALDLGTPGPDPVFGRGLVQGPTTCVSAASAD